MAIPSGGGSEVLKRIGIYNQSTTVTSIDWAQTVQTAAGNSSGTTSVPANVIISLLTVSFCCRNSVNRTVDMLIGRAVSGNAKQVLKAQPLPGHQTYVFSDKIVLMENDVLQFDASSDDIDILVNFIYQDWT